MSIKQMWVALCCVATLALAGCTPDNAATKANQAASTQKADAVGGKIVGRSTVKSESTKLPERLEKVPEVGPVYNVSVEKLVSLKPDFIMGNVNQHEKLKEVIGANNVELALFRVRTYDDVKDAMGIVGQVYGKQELAAKRIQQMDAEISATVAKLPKGAKKKVVILHATPSSVTVEMNRTIAGNCLELLGQQNIAKAPAGKDNPEKVPYSVESLVEANPDVIFITSMGNSERIQKRLRQDVEGSPVWKSLPAVQAGRVYVLPENYFLLNPGLEFPKAVEMMAQYLYPEAFK